MFFAVEDDGPGISQEQLRAMCEALQMDFHGAVSAKKLTSFDLHNIQRRIRPRFGADWGLTLESQPVDTRRDGRHSG